MLVQVYAAYGSNLDVSFQSYRMSLLKRGWVLAFVHARCVLRRCVRTSARGVTCAQRRRRVGNGLVPQRPEDEQAGVA